MTFPIPPIWYWLVPRFVELRDDGVIEGNALGINFIRDPLAYIIGSGYGVVDLIESPAMPGDQHITISAGFTPEGGMIGSRNSDIFLSEWGFVLDESNGTVMASNGISLVGDRIRFTKGSWFYLEAIADISFENGECVFPDLDYGICQCSTAGSFFWSELALRFYAPNSVIAADVGNETNVNWNFIINEAVCDSDNLVARSQLKTLISVGDNYTCEVAVSAQSDEFVILNPIGISESLTINMYNIPYFNSNL